jgi:acetylornithine deacetylase/succinyl-diaminopimelate desuccinylase-like protein
VGVGNRGNWTHDPYEGYEDDAVIYGRGGSDQEAAWPPPFTAPRS